MLVAVLDARDELLEHRPRARLRQSAVGDDKVEELAARHKLHHHVNIRGRVDHLIEADNVRVVEELEDLDLAADLLVHLELPDPAPV